MLVQLRLPLVRLLRSYRVTGGIWLVLGLLMPAAGAKSLEFSRTNSATVERIVPGRSAALQTGGEGGQRPAGRSELEGHADPGVDPLAGLDLETLVLRRRLASASGSASRAEADECHAVDLLETGFYREPHR